jgi:hypothetical protein
MTTTTHADYHYITARLLELAARPQGVTTNECAEDVGGAEAPVRAAIWKCKKKARIFSKAGLDSRGVYVNRNFTTAAAADAFTFEKVRHATAEGRAKKTRDLIFSAIDEPRTCRQIAKKIGRGIESATRSVQEMRDRGFVFAANTRCPQTKRVVSLIFSDWRARDDWQVANPVSPIIRTDKRERVARVRKPAKSRKSARSALSAVGRKDGAIAEMLSRRSIKAFEVAAKPVEYVLTDADKAKIKRIESAPGLGNRYYVPPSEVPMTFASLRPGQYLEVTA